MKNIRVYALCCLIAMSAACKNHLDVKPRGSVIPETSEQFSILLHQQLKGIDNGTEATIIGKSSTVLNREFFSDNLDVALAKSFNSLTPYYVGAYINKVQLEYKEAFELIGDYNIIISEMKDRESELAKKLLGTAYAMRAVNYYNMLLRFCPAYDPNKTSANLGLPIVEKFDMEAAPARANYATTVQFILNDFEKALSYNLTDKDYLFTTDVVHAYMARLYFWTQDWDNAIKYATLVLNKYPITPATEYLNMINAKTAQKKNTIIRSFTYESEDGNYEWSGVLGDMVTRPASKELVESFSEKQDDVRFSAYFDNKWFNKKYLTAAVKSEEMCLIIAESYAHKSDATAALNYLNQLRSNRITNNYIALTETNLPAVYPQLITVDATGKPLTQLLSAILCERRKELYMEGDRWFELKRNGCPEFWVPYAGRKYVTHKYLYTYPIYKKDIDLNPNLLIQNEGYQQ